MIRPDFRRDAEIGAQESRAQFVTSLVTNLGATVRGGLEETASRGYIHQTLVSLATTLE